MVEKQNIFQTMLLKRTEREYAQKQLEYDALQQSEKIKNKLSESQYLDMLRKKAAEAGCLMRDEKYPDTMDFLNYLSARMQGLLNTIAAHDKARDEMTLDLARLAYGLEIIEEIKNRPEKLVKELDRVEGELRKKGENR